MSSLPQLFRVADGACTGYLRSPAPYLFFSNSLWKRFLPHIPNSHHNEVKALGLLPFSLQIHSIFQGFSQWASKSKPAYQSRIRIAGYILMGLSISPWITWKLHCYLASKHRVSLACWASNLNRFLFLASFLSLLILNLANAGVIAFSAYKARDLREYSIWGATVIGLCVALSVSLDNTSMKILNSTLKLARCYFAKSKVEKVALGLWVAYDHYDQFVPR